MVDPEELTIVQWFGICAALAVSIVLLCNWLYMHWF
jgi:hypothetical protein